MAREIDPRDTKRATAFDLWMKAPNPTVTFFKTLNITPLIRLSKRHKLKLNMLLDYCIGSAASCIKAFYLLPVGDKLMQYDTLAVNTIVKNAAGGVSSCDILYDSDLGSFNTEYVKYTADVGKTSVNRDLSDSMVIGTSALTNVDIDGAVGIYSGIFNNPFLIWGRYKRHGLKYILKISFQFHHTQMDGAQAGDFLENLQRVIANIKTNPFFG